MKRFLEFMLNKDNGVTYTENTGELSAVQGAVEEADVSDTTKELAQQILDASEMTSWLDNAYDPQIVATYLSEAQLMLSGETDAGRCHAEGPGSRGARAQRVLTSRVPAPSRAGTPSVPSPSPEIGASMPTRTRALSSWLYILPALAFIALFVYYPLVANLVFGFFSFRAGASEMTPVGLDNFTRLLADPIIWSSLINNVVYAIVSIVCQVGGGLVVAAWLTHLLRPRIATILRSIYFMPAVISITVIALMFTFIYSARGGLLNSFLELIGLGELQTSWLANVDTAMGSVIAVSQWQSIGYICMLYVVTLQRSPSSTTRRRLLTAPDASGSSSASRCRRRRR